MKKFESGFSPFSLKTCNASGLFVFFLFLWLHLVIRFFCCGLIVPLHGTSYRPGDKSNLFGLGDSRSKTEIARETQQQFIWPLINGRGEPGSRLKKLYVRPYRNLCESSHFLTHKIDQLASDMQRLSKGPQNIDSFKGIDSQILNFTKTDFLKNTSFALLQKNSPLYPCSQQ